MHPLVELVKEKAVLMPCTSPIIVENNGRKYAVACGKCECCLQKKASIWRTRLRQEMKDNKFCLFFTLTFDNEHVPFFGRAENADFYTLDGEKGVQLKGDDNLTYSPKRSVPAALCRDCVPTITNFDVCDTFAVVTRDAAQKFMKRFRWHLFHLLVKHYKLIFQDKLFSFTRSLGWNESFPFKEWLDDLDDETYDLYYSVYQYYLTDYEKKKETCKQSVRYFICSEYTPTTFRPHYHGLLWFDDEKAFSYAPRCIYKAWKMCAEININVQPVSGDAASYVSKYVTGNSNLPPVLQAKSTRTFCLASKGPAIGYKSFSEERVLDMFTRRCIFRSYETISKKGKFTGVSVIPSSAVGRYFPKCYQYSTLSAVDKFRVYTRFIKLSRRNGVEKIDIPASLACFEWYKENTRLYPTTYVDCYGDTHTNEDCWFHQADITAARACLNWCVKYECHPNHYIFMLDWFWNEYAQLQLYQQCKLLEKFNDVITYDGISIPNYDYQLGADYSFLAMLPFRKEDAVNNHEINVILESHDLHVDLFYDHNNELLDREYLTPYFEYNRPHFREYLSKVRNDILNSLKSSKANKQLDYKI